MSETYFHCKCGFKCVEGQLAKTDGKCPKVSCQHGRKDMIEKFGG